MAGCVALIGGEEFADGFEMVHASLAMLARNQRNLPSSQPLNAVFLPTCAADDGPDIIDYWCDLATHRLEAAGATVLAPHLADRASAHDTNLAAKIAAADWIYLGGGYPHVGMHILTGTPVLRAMHAAWQAGALISGASAGAMMLCARSWVITPELNATFGRLLSADPPELDWEIPLPPPLNCLGWVPQSMCWPHTNRLFSMRWVRNGLLPPGHSLIGVDEQTALVLNGGTGQVLGCGRVFLMDSRTQIRTYTARMHVPDLPYLSIPDINGHLSDSNSTRDARSERGYH